ncbi:MAG TPA: class D sortase [Thermoanaerobaculia bacterium]|nr:class D sortase [Thermoanaerobaculia bacterium]
MNGRRAASLLLITAGLALCGVAARHYFLGWNAQREARATFEASESAPVNHELENPGLALASSRGDPASPSGIPAGYPYGEPVARLRIPAAGIDAIVFGGADQEILEKGPGHVPGTELPGRSTDVHNCVITGHRDSHFRHLGWLRPGSEVDLQAAHATRRYKVVSREIVTPETVRVLAPTASPRLTLITCYPFNYVGPAPKRLVVVAEPADQ